MPFIKLPNLISEHFTTAEIDQLAHDIGLDPENIFSPSSTKMNKAISLVRSGRNRAKTLHLLQAIHDQRPFLDLKSYLHLMMVENYAFAPKEITDMYVERYAEADGRYFVTDIYEQAQQIQAYFEKEDQATQFYDLVLSRAAQIEPYPFLKPDHKPEPYPQVTGPAFGHIDPPPPPVFVNFDINIDPTTQPEHYQISAEASDGSKTQNVIQIRLPQESTFTSALQKLRSLFIDEPSLIQLGDHLRQFLFPPEVAELYTQVKARHDKVRLRLKIRGESLALHQIPWEYCRDGRSYFATSKDTPLVRYLPVNLPESSLNAPKPLRVLVALASPSDMTKLDIQGEADRISEALQGLEENGRLQLKILKPATRRSLRKTFTEFQPHIFHFVGHGTTNANGEGALALQSPTGSKSLVDAEDMMRLVENNDQMRLVILAACQSAVSGDVPAGAEKNAGFLGVGPRMVWAGVPGVIAMQYAIPADTAFLFTQEVYDSLARGNGLDTAVTQARFAVFFDNDDKVFWGIPILFMRAPNGQIW